VLRRVHPYGLSPIAKSERQEKPSRTAMSDGRLSRLPGVHPRPRIPRDLRGALTRSQPSGRAHLGGGFALRCVQRFSVPDVATRLLARAGQPVHQRSGRSGPLVLGATPLNPPTPAADRDRTVSRRSEPSSRAALMGEQPNPWDRLQPQDATSRHRGAKPRRRCELLGEISLLSPG
jgi:hypothetical protein